MQCTRSCIRCSSSSSSSSMRSSWTGRSGALPASTSSSSRLSTTTTSSSSTRTTTRCAAFKLLRADDSAAVVAAVEQQERWVVGSAPAADLRLQQRPGIAPEHAELTQKRGQVFLRALVGESVFDHSGTWVDGEEVRPNVSYVLASGSRLEFGEGGEQQQQQAFVISFAEPSGANPLVEMLMRGAAASPDVKAALDES